MPGSYRPTARDRPSGEKAGAAPRRGDPGTGADPLVPDVADRHPAVAAHRRDRLPVRRDRARPSHPGLARYQPHSRQLLPRLVAREPDRPKDAQDDESRQPLGRQRNPRMSPSRPARLGRTPPDPAAKSELGRIWIASRRMVHSGSRGVPLKVSSRRGEVDGDGLHLEQCVNRPWRGPRLDAGPVGPSPWVSGLPPRPQPRSIYDL